MDSIGKFEMEVRRTVEYFRSEFDLTYAGAIGVLEIVKHSLVAEALDGVDNDDHEEG
jgi:hypothetical protein